jgi:hypothetical protein
MITGLYCLIGVLYWSINIFIRKLHTKNEPGEGWFLTPLWLFFWPICLISLFIAEISDYKTLKM